MIKVIAVSLGILLLLVLLLKFLMKRKQNTPFIGPYSEVKAKVIDMHRSGVPREKPDLVRPLDLYTRLSIETMKAHDQIDTSDEATSYPIVNDIIESISSELTQINANLDGVALMRPERQAVYIVWWVEAEINNGGFSQYYLNSSGDHASVAPDILREFGLTGFAAELERANACFPDGVPPQDRGLRLDILDDIEERAEEETWSEIESKFFQSNMTFTRNIIEYIRDHREAFYKVDASPA